MMAPTLGELVRPLGLVPPPGSENTPITGVVTDSRQAHPGALFVALRGAHVDGHAFVGAARQAGAAAALVEHPVDDALPQLVAAGIGERLAELSAAAYGHPSRALRVYAVTGSNGKTTSTYLIEAVGEYLEHKVGVIGTVAYRWPGVVAPAPNTTPFAADLQRILAAMRDAGVEWVAAEASSHAIDQRRVDHVEFAGAIFTNLSPEHLDYHRTMEAYRDAKARLFFELLGCDAVGVYNIDDEAGRWIAERDARRRKATFAVERDADFVARDIHLGADGARFTLHHPQGALAVETRLLGRHNVYNALGVLALLIADGQDPQAVAAGIGALEGVPGRLEPVDVGQPFVVVVDYAHSPDGLEQVLRTLSELPRRRLLTVFGCGGDRDRTKRPKMGAIAERYSDVVVVTSDNPRTEAPQAIVDEIVAGMEGLCERRVLVDRRAAIGEALSLAQAGDVVLIAGKGHETYQEFAFGRIDFDDRQVAREALEALGWRR